MYSQFFDFVKYSIGTKEKLNRTPTIPELESFYEMTSKKSLLGVTMEGLQKFQSEANLAESEALSLLIMKWYGFSKIMIERNLVVSKRCVEIKEIFKKGGFRTCLLKDQGNAQYYPKPELSQSGDSFPTKLDV